jgi:hypothetical protein
MAISVNVRMALGNESDLTTPTSTQNDSYKLGECVKVIDSATKMEKIYMYVKAHTTLTAYQPYVLNYTGTSGAEVKTAAPYTTAAPGQLVCVPQVAFTTTACYGFVQIKGDCTCLILNATVAAGDYLQILTTGTSLVVDGTSGATVMLPNSCAVSKDALYVAAGNNIILLGRWATTAAA